MKKIREDLEVGLHSSEYQYPFYIMIPYGSDYIQFGYEEAKWVKEQLGIAIKLYEKTQGLSQCD